MASELSGRLRLSGWLGSLVFHLLLILFAAPFLLRSPQFTVTTGKTSTEIELSAEPEPVAVAPPQPPVPPTPLPVAPPPPAPPPPVLPPPALPVKDSFVIPSPPKIIPSMPAPVTIAPKPPSQSPAKPHPAHKAAPAASNAALKGAVEAQPDDLHNDPPVYPDESRMAHEEGMVILRVEVTATGEAASISIKQSSGYFRLDQAARQAVKHWRFHPGLVAGLPVESEADVPLRFKLE